MESFLGFLALATTALAATAERTTAPPECLIVEKGSGKYSTIQSAVDALLPLGAPLCVFIHPGTYNEHVYLDPSKSSVTFYGYTNDTLSYKANQVTITNSRSQADHFSDDEAATLRVYADKFIMYNINVNNTHGLGSPAAALSVRGTSGFYGCAFTGFKETLLAGSNYQLYSNCRIEGATDFIYGQDSFAWFETCDLRVATTKTGSIAADDPQKSGGSRLVFNGCDIRAAEGATVSNSTIDLGRAWSRYASIVFQNSIMSPVVSYAGWSVQDPNYQPSSDGALFGEYNNHGPGALRENSAFAQNLSGPAIITSVLTDNYKDLGIFDPAYFGPGA